jgi:hypothetical protein
VTRMAWSPPQRPLHRERCWPQARRWWPRRPGATSIGGGMPAASVENSVSSLTRFLFGVARALGGPERYSHRERRDFMTVVGHPTSVCEEMTRNCSVFAESTANRRAPCVKRAQKQTAQTPAVASPDCCSRRARLATIQSGSSAAGAQTRACDSDRRWRWGELNPRPLL